MLLQRKCLKWHFEGHFVYTNWMVKNLEIGLEMAIIEFSIIEFSILEMTRRRPYHVLQTCRYAG